MRVLFIFAAALSLGAILSSAALIHDIAFNEVDKSVKRGYRDLLRRKGMSRLTAAVAFSQIGMNAVSAFIAIMIVDELGGSTAYVGYANAATSLIAALITGQIGKFVDRGGPVKALILAYASYIAFAFFFGVVKDPVMAALLWALPIYPLSATATTALAAQISGEDERGRAMSLIYGAQNAGGWIGPLIGGISAQYLFLSVQPISFLNMSLNVIALLLAVSLLGMRRSRKQSEHVSEVERQPSIESPVPE
jgi:MFS family permease